MKNFLFKIIALPISIFAAAGFGSAIIALTFALKVFLGWEFLPSTPLESGGEMSGWFYFIILFIGYSVASTVYSFLKDKFLKKKN
tara:strand:- start:124 stop:378 length:255 start_codon:yes stop_codon:yes gene_type:complete